MSLLALGPHSPAKNPLGEIDIPLLSLKNRLCLRIVNGGNRCVVLLAKFGLFPLDGSDDPLITAVLPKEPHDFAAQCATDGLFYAGVLAMHRNDLFKISRMVRKIVRELAANRGEIFISQLFRSGIKVVSPM